MDEAVSIVLLIVGVPVGFFLIWKEKHKGWQRLLISIWPIGGFAVALITIGETEGIRGEGQTASTAHKTSFLK